MNGRSQGSQGSWGETRAWRRFALSFAGRSKKRGQTKRSIFVAFSKRPCSLFRRSDEKRVKRRKKIRGTLKRIPSGRSERAFRLIILIYCRERNPTWLCRGGLLPCRKQCYIVVVRENFLTLSPLFASSFAPYLLLGLASPTSRASEPVPPHPEWYKRGKGFTSGNTEGGRPWQGPTTTMSGSLPQNTLAINEYARS